MSNTARDGAAAPADTTVASTKKRKPSASCGPGKRSRTLSDCTSCGGNTDDESLPDSSGDDDNTASDSNSVSQSESEDSRSGNKSTDAADKSSPNHTEILERWKATARELRSLETAEFNDEPKVTMRTMEELHQLTTTSIVKVGEVFARKADVLLRFAEVCHFLRISSVDMRDTLSVVISRVKLAVFHCR
eukprot:gb/GECG01005236.1/.p1 GENE.gb/GECG01005236.1/~~gb/GECG01005236.1/.p1  ORF type:complete len:190 (+),score=28.52 gb/GECG01005236.1/:1-570(+)